MKGLDKHIFNIQAIKDKALGDTVTGWRMHKFFNYAKKEILTPAQKREMIKLIDKETKRIINFIKTN